jgi:Zn-dependent M28 family amino/carboxypeptidase
MMKTHFQFLAISLAIVIAATLCVGALSTQDLDLNYDYPKKIVTELADDKYAGRNAGYPGAVMAGDYIAGQFKAMRIKPKGLQPEHVPYFQPFTYRKRLGNREHSARNVVAWIEGSDLKLKDEIVVVGAHYDHVGKIGGGFHIGRYMPDDADDLIYNGADDNASGTAGVLEIARKLKDQKLKRSVVFILFSAEEDGLHGSAYYCKNPTAGSIDKHVFMLNLDMIGRNPSRKVDVYGIPSAKRRDWLLEIVMGATTKYAARPNFIMGAGEADGRSDHSSFGKAKVPHTYFHTGLHADYHRVSDHSDRLAYARMIRIIRAATQVIEQVANLDGKLGFHD